MMKLIRVLLLVGLVFLLLPGGSCPPPPPPNDQPLRESPQETLKTFQQALEKRDYDAAFFCLSRNTRSRYPKEQFQMMLEWTIFGVLLRNQLIKWQVVNITYSPDRQSATVTLQHQKYPEYKKDFIFVYEERNWRVDITMAWLLGVPQEDEDSLLPVKPQK